MPEWLRVKNWDKFQHYKYRNPPWIRLYCDLDRDEDFMELTDAQKWWLVCCWQDASRDKTMTGLISANENPFKRRWGINSKTSVFDPLIERGFLLRKQDDSVTLADCVQSAIPETETETENRQSNNCIYVQQVVDKWNLLAEPLGLRLARVTDRKRKSITARMKGAYFAEHWQEAFEALPNLPDFWLGREPGKSWKITLDYVLKNDENLWNLEQEAKGSKHANDPDMPVRENDDYRGE